MSRFNGERLRELRIAEGIRTEQLALDVEKTNDTIRKWEAGNARPTIRSLCRLADRFGVEPGEFFTDDAA